ncbi:MAG TPA: PP0621 family protein [Rubrivivax sp.]|nr:hypothetical protein [Burkholderiales bacterium]HNU10481.1 PP0621 family protein [Rubrivivax sp.]
MKYLLIVLVVGIVLVAMSGRRRRETGDEGRSDRGARRGRAAPMLACAHCGVHLPRDEALLDAAGRAYCSQAHRLAGPQ